MRFRFNGEVRLIASAVLGAAILVAPARAEDIVIKMWTLDNKGYKEFIAEAAESFKATHPNVTIEHQIFPGDPYKTALKVALVGSDGPDVFFNWAGDRATQLVKDKLALDITDYGNVPGGFAKVLPQGLLDSFRYDGRLYGVATDAVTKYVFYDKAYFAEHKLELPKTLGELGGLCKAIRQIDPNTIPMPLGNKTRWKAIHWMTMLNERAMGVEATAADYDLSRPADQLYTDPGYAKAFQALVDLQDAGCFEDAPNATEYAIADSMFITRASPMEYCGSWCTSALDEAGFTDYGFFRLPVMEGGKGNPDANFLVPEGYQVSAKTAHPQEAVEWLSFLVSDEQALKFAEKVQFLPSNTKLIDKAEGVPQSFKDIASEVATVKQGVNVLDALLESTVADAYMNATVEVLNRTLTPEAAVGKVREAALAVQAKK
jgi:raffinose/stachyose/melibiose transport system substrate-binding protein